ncbi:hypothetical protein ACVIVC_003156 [Sinorhizobium meliloti]
MIEFVGCPYQYGALFNTLACACGLSVLVNLLGGRAW